MQLSVAVALPLPATDVSAVHAMVAFAGQVIAGGWASFTVMVNEQVAVLPATSVARNTIRVVPTGKKLPFGGPAIRASATVPGQLSALNTGPQVMLLPQLSVELPLRPPPMTNMWIDLSVYHPNEQGYKDLTTELEKRLGTLFPRPFDF